MSHLLLVVRPHATRNYNHHSTQDNNTHSKMTTRSVCVLVCVCVCVCVYLPTFSLSGFVVDVTESK